MRVLVTGGAGFIGSHLVDRFLEEGFQVRVLDTLDPKVHTYGRPDYTPYTVDFIHGTVTDRKCQAFGHQATKLTRVEGADIVMKSSGFGSQR